MNLRVAEKVMKYLGELLRNSLDFSLKVSEVHRPMGRGRKSKVQKMKNRKRQSAKKARVKKKADGVRRGRTS